MYVRESESFIQLGAPGWVLGGPAVRGVPGNLRYLRPRVLQVLSSLALVRGLPLGYQTNPRVFLGSRTGILQHHSLQSAERARFIYVSRVRGRCRFHPVLVWCPEQARSPHTGRPDTLHGFIHIPSTSIIEEILQTEPR